MRNLMRSIVLVAPFVVVSACSRPAPEPRTVTLSIEGMTCQNCVDGITGALTRTPGILSCEVSLENKRAVVTLDPAQLSPEQAARRVNQLGFTASVLPDAAP